MAKGDFLNFHRAREKDFSHSLVNARCLGRNVPSPEQKFIAGAALYTTRKEAGHTLYQAFTVHGQRLAAVAAK